MHITDQLPTIKKSGSIYVEKIPDNYPPCYYFLIPLAVMVAKNIFELYDIYCLKNKLLRLVNTCLSDNGLFGYTLYIPYILALVNWS